MPAPWVVGLSVSAALAGLFLLLLAAAAAYCATLRSGGPGDDGVPLNPVSRFSSLLSPSARRRQSSALRASVSRRVRGPAGPRGGSAGGVR